MTIKCLAPIRICDLGGWTDTWFAPRGFVLNIAVFPAVEATFTARKRLRREPWISLFAENLHQVHDLTLNGHTPAKHPLIEAAFRMFSLPKQLHLDAAIFSEAPAGASVGTSAAVSVALLGALDLLMGGALSSYEIASLAHRLETQVLGLQSGVQDQITSAYGGINFIEISHYPERQSHP
jgi:D-glycero-alpha-D-manno-heptose-7-phosphate kinase